MPLDRLAEVMISAIGHPSPHLIGYCRVSTEDQDNQRQIDDLMRFGVARESIYCDKASGRTMDRPGWRACWRDLRAGDLLVIQSVDRLGRDLVEILLTMRSLRDKGAQIKTLNMDIDTTTANGMFMLRIIAAIAEWEMRMIMERTRSGLLVAKARGHRSGRKPKITYQKALEAMDRIRAGENAKFVAADYGVRRQTIYQKVKLATSEPWRLTMEAAEGQSDD